jgi:hypothetical protein
LKGSGRVVVKEEKREQREGDSKTNRNGIKKPSASGAASDDYVIQ